MSLYRISETGNCSRTLAASRLGNKPTPETEDDRIRLKYYSSLEEICAQKLIDSGLEILPGASAITCHTCKNDNGENRSGIHVEIHTDIIDIDLVGHLDRRIQLKNDVYPLEIKCLGRFTWQKWIKDTFKVYPGYAMQEACYLEAEHKPGLYIVMNRDTGDLAKYIINDKDNRIQIEGFTNLELPITFEQVLEKLVNIEIEVSSGNMPKGDGSEQECGWCRYRYLCITTDVTERKVKLVNVPTLLDAAIMYKDGNNYEKLGKDMKQSATIALLEHAKSEKLDKYKVSDLSISYRGQTTRKWYDAKILEQIVDKKILKKAERQSEPYDSFSIRIINNE